MKQILCVFACLPFGFGAAMPPHPPVQAVERTDVVPINAFDRFMKDIGARKQSARSKQSERRRARPAKTRNATPSVPALATVPVPLPKPGSPPEESASPAKEAEDTKPVTAETAAPGSPETKPPMPDTAEKTPVPAENPAPSPEQSEAADVPKPMPKPEPPTENTAKPENTDKAEQKLEGEKPAAKEDEQKTAEPGKADQPKTDDEKKEEEKAENPPPPPLEKEDPEELKACLADITALGTKFETIPAITGEEPGCGIEQPIAVKEILPGVDTGGAQMRCETAKALATWMKDNVQPAMSVAMPGRRVTGIVPGSTYACRLRNSASSGKVSEHARGNAIDVAAFKLDNGETFEMKPREEDSTLEGAFQRTATASACLYFSTVLSPGSDATHQDHLHLDVLDRKNGYRYCR
ncbi:extensin family protein [Rhizobium panacihumi]|uniref:extensin-like domain-containing protein n=1 Tax=Rhizobium panacihumi TaxID=2008450 RepID=UPI003D7B39C8